ncbi:MAG: acyl CoA:acetate/3-ketoacid CoA transferase [Thaumarchaeota archaeon]|nr:acyl CoA:acetate/3-ketoacid CoA transferase [Nitrososphaerota archaeon]
MRLARPKPSSAAQVVAADFALAAIDDRAVLAISGFNMATTPEYLILELLRRYERTGHPKGLFLICDALPAIPDRALDRLVKELYESRDFGLMRGISVPFLGFSPWLQRLVTENRVEAYSWPMGVAAYWFREVSSGRPGVISKVGIDTAIDPRKDGGKLNGLAESKNTCSVKRIKVDQEDYLLYEAPKPNFAFIRGTTADGKGNVSMEDEAIRGTVLSIAQATKAHPDPGMVVAQVRRASREPSLPRSVEVPGPLVDYVVVSPEAYHWQAGTSAYNPSYSSNAKIARKPPDGAPMDPTQRVIARRVLVELVADTVHKGKPVIVNLGVGIPALVSRLAIQERVSDFIVTVLESGQWGGLALPGVDFGVAVGPFALSTMPDMFSNFEGGTIDAASLGFLQVGENGDVNPSMLPGRIYGPGGFPVIAGGSPRIYFAGAFTAGESKIEVVEGKVRIRRDGGIDKFVRKVYRNFFSGNQAHRFGKEVAYFTERAAFRLGPEGLILTEIAPGVDLDKDVLGKMGFKPRLDKNLRIMDRAIFSPTPMNLSRRIRNKSAEELLD